MKKTILTVFFCLACFSAKSEDRDSLLVMFWNVENFFDWKDQGTGDSDKDFSSHGEKMWTKGRFYEKCNTMAKAIFWIADRYGRLPDVIGFAEVENRGVLSRFLSSTLLRKADYGIVHFDSPDRRGIDVALLYRKSVFRLSGTSLKVPCYDGKPLETRHMLQVSLNSIKGGEDMSFIVCHHPSKYGGAELSHGRRVAAMESLRQMCDSLETGSVVVMGDFNDIPSAPQFEILGDILDNKAEDLFARHQGTIRYRGKWELIDMFMVGEDLSERSRMEIVKVPFLMTEDARHSGEKPLRTYSGPRYMGGVSDHCPVVLELW